MTDIILLLVIVAFFAAAALLVRVLDGMIARSGEDDRRAYRRMRTGSATRARPS